MNPSCHGKTRYRSFKDAQKVAQWQSRRHDEPFKAYACRLCSGFHTAEGHSDPKPIKTLNHSEERM